MQRTHIEISLENGAECKAPVHRVQEHYRESKTISTSISTNRKFYSIAVTQRQNTNSEVFAILLLVSKTIYTRWEMLFACGNTSQARVLISTRHNLERLEKSWLLSGYAKQQCLITLSTLSAKKSLFRRKNALLSPICGVKQKYLKHESMLFMMIVVTDFINLPGPLCHCACIFYGYFER